MKSETKAKFNILKPTIHYVFEAIGTHWTIDIYEPLPTTTWVALQTDIQQQIEAFDKTYSRFREDSLVTQMATSAGTYDIPYNAEPLLKLYEQLYKLTDGAVTPLIGQTLADAGYDASYSLQPQQLQRPPDWEDVLDYSPNQLTLKRPALLDFGAAGKGYLVDIISSLLLTCGIQDFCVDASGDILYRTQSDTPMSIGLEHPDEPGQILGVASIKNQSLCGSSPNRRAWGKYHHIINPKTLTSPSNIRAVWVVADNGLLCDGLTTALFFTTPEALLSQCSFEYAIIYADHSLQHSPHFPGTFYTKPTRTNDVTKN